VPRLYRGIVFLTNLFFILAIVCLLATELRKLLSDSIKTTLYLTSAPDVEAFAPSTWAPSSRRRY
jgi:hypothetical protein